MYDIAVLGDRQSVMGFKALGLTVVPAETTEEGRSALLQLAKEGCSIIYITEQLALELQAEIARYDDCPSPAVILIPGKGGSLGVGMANVKRSVERAVGADIL